MATIWKLRELIDKHNVTPNALSERTRGRLSRNAVYHLASTKQAPKRLEVGTFDALIPALRELTGEPVEVADLLEYRPDPPRKSASGLAYTGDTETDAVLDDPELTKRLLVRKEEFEGLAPEEVAAKLEADLSSGRLVPLEHIKVKYGIVD